MLLGAGLLLMKTTAPVIVEYLGQSFVETTGEYWVDSSTEIMQRFEKETASRQTTFLSNPLLKRIDPLGIIESLGGFLVQSLERSKEQRVESVLISAPVSSSSVLALPIECQNDKDGKH